MSFFNKVFNKLIREKAEIIIGEKYSNDLKDQLVPLLNIKAPIGKSGDYDFGDVFKHEYDEFALFGLKLSIIHAFLRERKILGTNQKGEIVPLYQLFYCF